MIGIIDVGGGMRCAYSAGVYDCFLDQGFYADYCIGVSAGSANLISYVAKQKGRNLKFYNDFALRKEYMGFSNFVKRGAFFDFDYIYSTLSDEDGEAPLDYDAVFESPAQYVAVATEAESGTATYFTKDDITRNNINIIKASCNIPVLDPPYTLNGVAYYDGGIAAPIPVKKALDDGCEKVIAVLSRPADYYKKKIRLYRLIKTFLRAYPATAAAIGNMHLKYNESLRMLHQYETEGRAMIIAPSDCQGVDTATKSKEATTRLYEVGYQDAYRQLSAV